MTNLIKFDGSKYEEPKWGSSGKDVYERTYQRTKPDGTKENWYDTVERVVDGNLGLVDPMFIEKNERARLIELMSDFKIIPGGRHLWMSGVPGRQFLFNCHVSGWTDNLSDHFAFTFNQLMQGGGVGANYSYKYVGKYNVTTELELHIVCDPGHADYQALKGAGLLSDRFVAEGMEDSAVVQDSREGWSEILAFVIDQSQLEYSGAVNPVVIDVSTIRKSGDRIKSFGGTSAGPVPFAKMLTNVARILNETLYREWERGHFGGHMTPLVAMDIDHAIAECVVAGNVRRSARMSIVNWDDPYVFEFIKCKQDPQKHWSTNISVGLDEKFFEQTKIEDSGWATQGQAVLEAVAMGMLENGEPGFANLALLNHGEPGVVVCTNPCGEIGLEEWENCNLGNINMDAFAEDGMDEILEAHHLMARFLVRATFGDVPDDRQRAILARNRRIGVGHLGFAGFVAKQGIKYSEAPDNAYIYLNLRAMKVEVRETARDYAFQLRIPEPVKVTTVAPTGTIAKLPGVAEGVHPVMYKWYVRRIRYSTVDPDQKARLDKFIDEGYFVEPDAYSANTWVVSIPTEDPLVGQVKALGLDPSVVESSSELTAEQMLAVQHMYQLHYADNAVSYTVNIKEGDIDHYDLYALLKKYLPHLKGTTVFPGKTRPQAPYEEITEEEYRMARVKQVADSVDEECATGACPVR